jgi:hypothetical protein
MKKIIKLGSLIFVVSLMSMSLEAKNLPSKVKSKKLSVINANVHRKNNKVVDLENCSFDACGHIVSCVICDITVKAKPAPICNL